MEICHESCYKFTAESNSEGIFKIGEISQSYERISSMARFFMAHGVYLLNDTAVVNIRK